LPHRKEVAAEALRPKAFLDKKKPAQLTGRAGLDFIA
jgi:hypothetical protein